MPTRLRNALPWLLGFFLTANTYVLPFSAKSPRATDLIALLLTLWCLHALARRRIRSASLTILAVGSILPLAWVFGGALGGDAETAILAARWLLAVPWALALRDVMLRDDDRDRFLFGLVGGLGLNAAVVVAQQLGFQSLMQTVGLAARDSAFHAVYHQIRLTGIHGHHSPSAAVTSLMVPATLYLYFRGRCRMWLPLAGLFALLITLHLTSTRSPLVVSAVVIPTLAILSRRLRPAARLLGTVAVVMIVVLATVGPPGGRLRWGDMVSTTENAGERFESNRVACELSLQHPFGMGITAGREEMLEELSVRATHNAYLQASIVFGIPQALLVVIVLGAFLWRLRSGAGAAGYLEAVMALHLALLFVFEEHLNNPTFIILLMWLAATLPDLMRPGARRSVPAAAIAAGPAADRSAP